MIVKKKYIEKNNPSVAVIAMQWDGEQETIEQILEDIEPMIQMVAEFREGGDLDIQKGNYIVQSEDNIEVLSEEEFNERFEEVTEYNRPPAIRTFVEKPLVVKAVMWDGLEETLEIIKEFLGSAYKGHMEGTVDGKKHHAIMVQQDDGEKHVVNVADTIVKDELQDDLKIYTSRKLFNAHYGLSMDLDELLEGSSKEGSEVPESL